jgi:hypothetical protein
MNSRGGIWVSAILYFAMGVILLTIILAAGLPAISKMKDSYTVRQTKDLMITLDSNIRTIYHEGPGSQRTVNINIGRGEFFIKEADDYIQWDIESSAIISEVDVPIQEGSLQILTSSSGVDDSYGVSLILNYTELGLNLTFGGPDKILGDAEFSLLNGGGDPIQIIITQL